jgi:sigma-B regulation protein RsbU (phosphoserine phosphatase)
MMGFSPKEVLSRVNKQICSNNQDEMFVTVWLGVLDLKTGLLTASNGGHEKPILMKPNGEFEEVNDKHNLVVGFIANAPYTEYQLQLEKGSKLFVYTDGVPEASNGSEQFKVSRTLESLNKYKDERPEAIAKGLLKDVNDFIGTAAQFDDITMLCLEYIGYENDVHKITAPATKAEIKNVINPILELLKENGVDHKTTYKIELALDELLTNVASYAYDNNDGVVEVEYEIKEDPKTICISIIDEGKEFDPLASEDPDITLPSEERVVGGLGIFLVKNIMDEIKYQRINNKNVLKMKKKI